MRGPGAVGPNVNSQEPSSIVTRRSGEDITSNSQDQHGNQDFNPPRTNIFDVKTQETQNQSYFGSGGTLRPFRLLKQDFLSLRSRYASDWTVFNQQVVASSVYIFFTNILPGITFASDLYSLTGMSWGTIEIVFSTGLCGFIFAL